MQSHGSFLADMEARRLEGKDSDEDGVYGPGETQIDPCTVSRRLTENRRAQDRALVALSITGCVMVLALVSIFLMTLGPRTEHKATSRRTGAPAWHRCQADIDDSSRGAWFVETESMHQDPIYVERIVLWLVHVLGTMLLTGAYAGHVGSGG